MNWFANLFVSIGVAIASIFGVHSQQVTNKVSVDTTATSSACIAGTREDGSCIGSNDEGKICPPGQVGNGSGACVSEQANQSAEEIEVATPENVKIGIGTPIKWTTGSLKINVLLQAYNQDGSPSGNFIYLDEADSNNGIFNWVPSSSINTTLKYKIVVTRANDLTFGPADKGESDFFIIKPNQVQFANPDMGAGRGN